MDSAQGFAALDVEFHALQLQRGERALGGDGKVNQVGTLAAQRHDVAVGLVDGDRLDGHRVVDEGTHCGTPAGAGVVSAGVLGVEAHGQRAVGGRRAQHASGAGGGPVGVAQSPQQVRLVDCATAIYLKESLYTIGRTAIGHIETVKVQLNDRAVHLGIEGDDVVAGGGVVLARGAFLIGKGPLAVDIVAVGAGSQAADVLDGERRAHRGGRGLHGAGDGDVAHAEGHLVVVVEALVHVDNDGEIVVSFTQSGVAGGGDGVAAHLARGKGRCGREHVFRAEIVDGVAVDGTGRGGVERHTGDGKRVGLVVGEHINDEQTRAALTGGHSRGGSLIGSGGDLLEGHVARQELAHGGLPAVGRHAGGAHQGDGHRAVGGRALHGLGLGEQRGNQVVLVSLAAVVELEDIILANS